MSRDYDIIVVGGGPAGLKVAKTASGRGMEVLLLELQAQIGGTQTSAWINPEILKGKLGNSVKSDVNQVGLHSVHKDLEIEGDFGKIIDRKTFDKILASEAVKNGAGIWVSSPVKNLITGKSGVQGVRSEAGEWSEDLESEIVVDATGARAEWSSLFLREVLDSNWDIEKTTQTNEYLMTNISGEKRIDLYFNSMLAPRGYAWIHSLGQEFAMAGIRGVRIHPDSALDEFIGREKPDRLKKSEPIGAYRGQLPIQGPLNNAVEEGILAVGSSAGQIYPFSGHGIKYSLKAGEIAGRIVAEAIQEEDTSKEKLSEYDRLWRNEFEKEIQVGKMLQDSFETSPDQKMDSLIEVLMNNSELQKDFIKIFLGKNLDKSLKDFFKGKECKQIFGKKRVDKILSLYS